MQAIHPPTSVGGIPLVGSGPPFASWDHSHGLGKKGIDIASAAALQLGPDGSYFHVTGTTTITSISKRIAGDIVVLEFDGALTFTHNSTNLILHNGVNRTTAAGDICVLVSEGAGNWREIARNILSSTFAPTSADYLVGTANSGLSAEIVVGTTPGGELGGTWASPTVDATHSGSAHGWVLITDTTTASSAASVTFASISGSYKHLVIIWQARGDTAALTAGLRLQFNADTGNNYDRELMSASAGTQADAELLASDHIRVGGMPAASVTRAAIAAAGTITIPNYAGTTFEKSLHAESGYVDSTTGQNLEEADAGSWRNTAAVTQIKLYPNAGNFVDGSRFTLYGLN